MKISRFRLFKDFFVPFNKKYQQKVLIFLQKIIKVTMGHKKSRVQYRDNPATSKALEDTKKELSNLTIQSINQSKLINANNSAMLMIKKEKVDADKKLSNFTIQMQNQKQSFLNTEKQNIKNISNLKGQISNIQKNYGATKKKLSQMEEKYEKEHEQLYLLKDPTKIQSAQDKLFEGFIDDLKTFNMFNPLPKQGNYKFAAVIGQNSAGKSAIYNWALGTKEKVGVDDTTQDIAMVYDNKVKKIKYFDSPGLNQTISITNAHTLEAFRAIDYVFVATRVTFKNCKRTIQVMNKINPPKLFLVRTQCDAFENDADFQQCVEKDTKVVESFGVKAQILYISAFKDKNFKDNQRFLNLLTDS